MSLYVKGESKPNVCEECWFHVRWNRFEDLQCGLNDGKIIAMNTYEYKGKTAIPDWCPLVEIPEPHGRLIDADVLCERLMAKWPTADENGKKIIPEVMSDVVTPIVVGTPTVIEEEGE